MDRAPHEFREVTAVGGGCFFCNAPRSAHVQPRIWPETEPITARQKKGKKHWVTSRARARREGREAKYWIPQD